MLGASMRGALSLLVVLAAGCGSPEEPRATTSTGGTSGSAGSSLAGGAGASGAAAAAGNSGTSGSGASGVGGSSGAAGSSGGAAGSAGSAGAPPADVAGEFSVTTTAGKDTCASSTWKEGDVMKDIPFTITQMGSDITGKVGGWAGFGQSLLLGNNAPLTGTVLGTTLSMKAVGDLKKDMTCESFWTAVASATVTGDAIQGDYTYVRTVTVDTPDCAAAMVIPCTETFAFAGVRPPKM